MRHTVLNKFMYGNYTMFDWLVSFFTSILAFFMSLFGIEKKSVRFADEAEAPTEPLAAPPVAAQEHQAQADA
jgi:CBS domain containing-hemolysin-like protein